MELRDFLELGARKAGSLTALGNMLGLSQPNMSNIKAGKMALPTEDCVKLADYIGADKFDVIAAAKYACSKNEEKKAFWRPFVEHARAAMLACILTIVSVSSFMTPSPAEAKPAMKVSSNDLYYVKSDRSKQAQLVRRIKLFFKAFATIFQIRPLKRQAI